MSHSRLSFKHLVALPVFLGYQGYKIPRSAGLGKQPMPPRRFSLLV